MAAFADGGQWFVVQRFPFKVTLYITVLHSLLFTFKKVAISGIDDQTERSPRPHN